MSDDEQQPLAPLPVVPDGDYQGIDAGVVASEGRGVTPRGVPYVSGNDVAGAYPETSQALAAYLDARIIDRRGDTFDGRMGFANGLDAAFIDVGGEAYVRTRLWSQNECRFGAVEVAGGLWVNNAAIQRLDQDAKLDNWDFLVTTEAAGGIRRVARYPGWLLWLLIQYGRSAAPADAQTRPADVPDVTTLTPVTWTDDGGTAAPRGEGDALGLDLAAAADLDPRLVIRDDQGDPQALNTGALLASLIAKVADLQERIATLEEGTR